MICTFVDLRSVAPALLSLPAKLLFVCLFMFSIQYYICDSVKENIWDETKDNMALFRFNKHD